MTEPAPDRPNRYPWPPIIYAVALAFAVLLDKAAPAAIPTLDGWQKAGWAIAACGVAIAVAGLAQFQITGTSFDPTGSAKALATGGIYRWTRNPMYLGGVIFFIGLALALQSGWLMLAVPFIALALQKLAILPEEAYLSRRFGAPYAAYCARVHRWL